MKPVHCRADRGHPVAAINHGAFDQHHLDAQGPRGLQFRFGATASGVFGDDQVNAVLAQQGQIAFKAERAAIDGEVMIAKAEPRLRMIDQTQQEEMLIQWGEKIEMLATDGQKDTAAAAGQPCGGGVNIGQGLPNIPRPRRPLRPFDRQQRHIRRATGHDGVVADLLREGMGGINHLPDPLGLKVIPQPADPGKAADPDRNRLRAWRLDASGVRQDGGELGGADRCGQGACFGRSAQNEGLAHA